MAYYLKRIQDCPKQIGSNSFVEDSIIFKISDDTNLPEMCEAFTSFLKASGYVFEGFVTIVKGEEDIDAPSF